MAKVIGLGGVFFLCEDPEVTQAWYSEVLGIEATEYGGFSFAHAASAACLEARVSSSGPATARPAGRQTDAVAAAEERKNSSAR